MSTLPHDHYITAVTDALYDVGIDPADHWTDDSDTRGMHRILRGVITLTPEDSGLDADRWPEGLLLIWEWHPGREESEAPRGPVWMWAKKLPDGSNSTPAPLRVDGYANPVQVAAAVGEVITIGASEKVRIGTWAGARALAAAIDAWEASS